MTRSRDLGIQFSGEPGPYNAITDVEGVEVGQVTLISGNGRLIVGEGPIRTGVTAILPRGKAYDPVFAGLHVLNGNGEMTGAVWIEESGFLDGPILLTNTHSVGLVRDTVVSWLFENNLYDPIVPGVFWSLPVVAETYDGRLNDINGFHIKREHVIQSLENISSGMVAEGNVGGGTGMICHEFKGGTGTASRKLTVEDGGYTIGVLVQANHGSRENLTIRGAPVGQEITNLKPLFHKMEIHLEMGSVIVIVATDAPLLPHQLKRLARRVPMGLARVGSIGGNGSGDIFLAFSTANPNAAKRWEIRHLEMLPHDLMNPLFEATVQATEEAVVNALVAARTMEGINGNIVYALPHDRLVEVLKKYHRHNSP
jgi:D-aminopeptidase